MASTTTPTAAETWCKLMRRSLSMRIEVEQFETYARSVLRKAPLPRDELASVLISPAAYPTPQLSVDPRYLLYIQRLVSANIVPLSSFLHALWSSDRVQQNNVLHGGEGDMAAALSRESVDTAVLTSLVLVVQNSQSGGGANAAPRETSTTLIDALSKWMDAVIAANDGDGLNVLDGHGLDGLGLSSGIMGSQKKAIIAELVLAVGENQTLNGFLKTSHEISKDKRTNFENTLPMFAQGFQTLNPQLAMRLDTLIPKKVEGPGGTNAGNGLLGMGMGLDAIGDVGQPSRGGLYVFINSMLFARPLVDDEYLIHHLLNRYKEIGGQAAIDLITAALDCISNAISRSESESTIALFRHFLVNKIPLLLSRFSMPAIQAQYVLTRALQGSGSNAQDPLLDTMLDLSNDIKQELLFACALHHIIEETQVEGILGEVPLQTMAKRRYTQVELVDEGMLDVDGTERLISEIEELDGNSGAIVGAVVEMLRLMCEQRATMGLYTLCKNLISRPKTIDLLLLYSSPTTILEPLCIVLENWRYEDDQGEYEPVYKEFGYILLLILTIYYRHNLSFSHLGPSITSTSFVPMFIKQCWKDISVEDLGRMGDRHAQLGGWIKALYEGEGITDEVMQSCRPQEYYSLVPTLMAQTVEACERGVLEMRVLREGLDYLQLSSLIASEVAIIFWLTDYIWHTMSSQGDISHALRILHILVTNAPSEVTQTHKTILAICSHSLERVLRDVLRSEGATNNPNSAVHQQAEQILKQISSSRDWRRTGLPSASELEGWTKHSGGILGALKSAVQGVIVWSGKADTNTQPAVWNPRLIYAAWRLLGAKEVLRVLIDEVASAAPDVGDVAADVVASLIVAPIVEDWRWKVGELTGRKEHLGSGNGGVITLVEALRYLEDDSKMSGGEDQARTEVIMKVARKVEMMMVAPPVGAAAAAVGGVVDLADGVLGDVMVDSDMLMGIPDLGLTADEMMGGM